MEEYIVDHILHSCALCLCYVELLFAINVGYNYTQTNNGRFNCYNDLWLIYSHKMGFSF